MPMVCQICSHHERLEIDRAVLSGMSKSEIADRFSVPYHSLRNHAEHHLSRQLIKAHETKDILNADALLDETRGMISRIKDIELQAHNGKLLGTGLKAIAELRATFEFLIKLGLSLQRALAEESQAETRHSIDELKENLSVLEMETLMSLLLKAKGEGQSPELLSARWSQEPPTSSAPFR